MSSKFFLRGELDEKKPQKIIKLLQKTKCLFPEDNIFALLGGTTLGSVGNCFVALESEIVYYNAASMLGTAERFAYDSITSISLSTTGGISRILFTISSAAQRKTNPLGDTQEVKKMVDFIQSKIST